MASSRKRNFERAEDLVRSDPEDEDFRETSLPRPRTRPQARSAKAKNATRKPAKRRRDRYGGSDDDIEATSDEQSEEEEFIAPSEEEEEVLEHNPKTGRGVRSVAKKVASYEVPSEDDLDIEDAAPEPTQPTLTARDRRSQAALKRPSLVVTLKLTSKMDGRSMRPRTGSKSLGKREPTPAEQRGMGIRKSSRISRDDEAPLVALSDSGKHEQVTRAGSATPEPPAGRRPTRASKGLKKPPSAIMEASQEDSQAAQLATQEDLDAELQVPAGQAESEALVQRTSPEKDEAEEEIQMELVNEDEQVVQESMNDDDDEDEAPVIKGGRAPRLRKASTPPTSQPSRTTRRSTRARKPGVEQSSDFDPGAEGDAEADMDENVSESDERLTPRGGSSNGESRNGRRSGRLARKTASQRSRSRRHGSEEAEDDLDPEEVADEAADLEEDHRRNKRSRRQPAAVRSEIAFEPNLRNRGKKVDYRVIRPELILPMDDDDAPGAAAMTPQRNRRTGGGAGTYRSLFSTFGPFGGAGGPPPVFGGPEGAGATAGVDSDSSDDEVRGGQHGMGGTVGMTPTSAFPKPFVPQTLNNDPIQGPGGGPPGLGKVKDRKALADADPLGIDPNVSFDGVGGLGDQIDRLKEMVALPLLYPEVFQRFHVTPPRGVLFHGPPGTGKTLLARALASSVSSHGKKVTFYMRKGADALSKWVGEAEKQLRLLFEEARKNQPSIIFFDEIDGLAPVRSSKQEQIHASIVATLLALMDGMDGRGQVIVIGATNRPDSVDPALRRPGRFDREFYFPLPDQPARRAIIDINTKGWDPPLQPAFSDQLAEITRGYSGADIRALCTEAALNAVQGTFPQIYSSDQKLVIDPSLIKVLPKDFMISVNKLVPSSERSAASGAVALKKDVEPLLRRPLVELTNRLDEAIPRKRKATALEEAQFDDRDDEHGFERETMQRQFESARVFRPRLLIHGVQGMGQQYLGAALLSKLEGVHVQNFDMATLMKDSTRSPEAAIVQLFEEVKRHKPSVIYLPNVDVWYHTLSDSAIRTFTGLLRSLPPTDPVLVLGVMDWDLSDETEMDELEKRLNKKMLQDLFNYSGKNRYCLARPDNAARREFYQQVIDLISKPPSDFPEPEQRKRRKLVELPVAAVHHDVTRGSTKEEQKAQKRKDRLTLNMLKLHIQTVMDQIKIKYKKFRTPVVDEATISYLYDEQNPGLITTDLSEEQRQQQQLFRPYELEKDEKGVPGLREVASGKFYYNLEIVTIEKRLSNGYYKRPKDYLADIKRLAKDAKTSGDADRTLKANEMLANVDVDMSTLEQSQPVLVAECEAVYQRELERERERMQKDREAERNGETVPKIVPNVPPPNASKTTTETSGPVMLGQEVPGRPELFPFTPGRFPGPSPSINLWSTTNGSHPSHQTNGSTVPPRPREDSEMLDTGSQHELYETSQREPHITPSQGGTQGQRSQKGALTHVAHGSQLDQYHNSASTTTSGKKTSDRSSGPYSIGTQYSNGVRGDHPDFSMMATAGHGGSQIPSLPDTQPHDDVPLSQPSQSSQPQQQAMAPPAAPPAHSLHPRQSSIVSILNNNNDSEAGPGAAQQEPSRSATNRLILDPKGLHELHEQLVQRSSGFSVEQLEQVNAQLMDVLWKTRGNWNRTQVLMGIKDAFNETGRDIEAGQKIAGPSQPK
ncbi:TAT-binding protein-like protein 7, AAA ATPase [Friedmanniomyces endolithicus]|nr:TAT-binding protein-like protein 7, AAA ATPase [Friedmanniomyces endolithicus]